MTEQELRQLGKHGSSTSRRATATMMIAGVAPVSLCGVLGALDGCAHARALIVRALNYPLLGVGKPS
jgi:hypothetical protein